MTDKLDKLKELNDKITELRNKISGESEEKPESKPAESWFKGKSKTPKGKIALSTILGYEVENEKYFTPFKCPDHLKKYIPEIDPHFVFDEEYATALLQAIELNEVVSAHGPAGSGKTETPMQLCARLGYPFMFLSGMGGTDPSDYVGMQTLKGDKIEWVDGDLTFCVRNGIYCLFDEPYKVSPATLMCIQSLIDGRRTLKLHGHPVQEEATLKAHPAFRMAFADNVRGVGEDGHKYCSEVQDRSTLNRSMFKVFVDYPAHEVEVEILARRFPDAHPQLLDRVVSLAKFIREGYNKDNISLPYSLRDTANFVRLAMLDGSAVSAFKKTYYDAASSQEKVALQGYWKMVDFNGEVL